MKMIKTKHNAGESLIETLVSILIVVFAVMALTAAIVNSGKMTAESSERLQAYYEKNNELSEMTGTGTSGTITLTEGGSGVKITPDGDSELEVIYFINDEIAAHEVVSYKEK